MHKAKQAALLSVLTLPIFMPLSYADHPSTTFGANQAGPLITIPASGIGAGTWSTGLRTERINFSPLSDTVLQQAAHNAEDIHSVDSLTTHYISLAYGVSETLTLGLTIPYVNRKAIRSGELHAGHAEVHAHQDVSGMGDSTLLALYQLSPLNSTNTKFALLAGLQLPTGDDDISEAGTLLEGEFQPGSGTWHPMIGIAASRTLGLGNIDANLLYLHTREGSQHTLIGNLLNYNLAWSYRFKMETPSDDHDHSSHQHIDWDAILELNGELRAKNEAYETKSAHSGGNLIYLSPGIRVTLADKWHLYTSLSIPVLDDSNGTQADIDYRTNIGLSASF